MSLTSFQADPFKDHPQYSDTLFHLFPAPEFATGEVMTAGIYRAVGYEASETDVAIWGKSFKENLDKGELPYTGGTGPEIWQKIIREILASPRQPGQQKQLLPSISPLVPEACLFSNTARQQGHPWNPGNLVLGMLECGSSGAAKTICAESIFPALSIEAKDDPWARFLSKTFRCSIPAPSTFPDWRSKETLKTPLADIPWDEWRIPGSPSRAFVNSLPRVMGLKDKLTRRQWVSVLEAILRISCASHVAWVCRANLELWQWLLACFSGPPNPDTKLLCKQLFKQGDAYWPYGERIDPLIQRVARGYISGRLGINALLHQATRVLGSTRIDLKSPNGIIEFGKAIYEGREQLDLQMVRKVHVEVLESNPQLLACAYGITSNMKYFFRYTLGQRRSVSEEELNYDQGYWVKKAGTQRSASWIVSGGPVALMAMVSCCCSTHQASRTVEDFCRFLQEFGVMVTASDLVSAGLGDSLRRLGLVVDSPDAEGGMVLIDPFTA